MSKKSNFRRSLKRRFQKFRFPKFLTIQFGFAILTAPFRHVAANWKNQRIRDFILGIPALVASLLVMVLLGRAQLQEKALSPAYLASAKQALLEKNFPYAELLLNRVLQRKDSVLSEARYSMAVLLEEVGETKRASELFAVLAPDDGRGNPNAHRRLAIILANGISAKSSPEDIRRLYWHLNASNDTKSPNLSMAWGRYSLATGDLASALHFFRQSVDEFPELLQILGALELQSGNNLAATTHFQRSSKYLDNRLRNSPSDDETRIAYAQVLMKIGQFDEARVVLEQGATLDPQGPWNWLLASLAVNYHDLKSTEGVSVSELLSYLKRALDHDPNHELALKRLMSYATAKVEGNVELRTVLARVIAEGDEPALAHLAMGNLCWLEGDSSKAEFHFERATAIRTDMAVVLNNLAWLVAHDKNNPDYERAMTLVQAALEQRPNSPDFLDTRGTILLLQEQWKPALNDLEVALSGVKDKRAVHLKLATVYTNLNLPEIAEQHRILSE